MALVFMLVVSFFYAHRDTTEAEPQRAIDRAGEYVDALGQHGVQASIVSCIRIGGPKFACTLVIGGKIERIDCHADLGCYPSGNNERAKR